MTDLKTKETDADVIAFIETIDNVKKRTDAYQLLDIFAEVTGYEARMWGTNMIGFGKYHYAYASGHEGTSMLVGFAPKKTKHSLYFASGTWRDPLLEKFGKYQAGKACIYINKIADINIDILKELIVDSVTYLKTAHPENTIL